MPKIQSTFFANFHLLHTESQALETVLGAYSTGSRCGGGGGGRN